MHSQRRPNPNLPDLSCNSKQRTIRAKACTRGDSAIIKVSSSLARPLISKEQTIRVSGIAVSMRINMRIFRVRKSAGKLKAIDKDIVYIALPNFRSDLQIQHMSNALGFPLCWRGLHCSSTRRYLVTSERTIFSLGLYVGYKHVAARGV